MLTGVLLLATTMTTTAVTPPPSSYAGVRHVNRTVAQQSWRGTATTPPTPPPPPPAPPPGGWRGAGTPPPPSAPPPPVVEQPRPRHGWVWVEGGYAWRGRRYVKLPGHWERERHGHRWQTGHWEWRGDHHEWVAGAWLDQGPVVVAPPPPVVVQTPPPPPPPPPPPGHGHRRISIGGEIRDQYGRPAAGITVVLAGTSEGRVVTDQNGRYYFGGLIPGSYAVRPNNPRCGFGPDVMNLNNLYSDATQNFNANCR
jgi:hypothetical protein